MQLLIIWVERKLVTKGSLAAFLISALMRFIMWECSSFCSGRFLKSIFFFMFSSSTCDGSFFTISSLMNWFTIDTIFTARYFYYELDRMQYSEDSISYFEDFCYFLRFFFSSLKVYFSSLLLLSFTDRLFRIALRSYWQKMSTLSGLRNTQVLSQFSSILRSSRDFRFFSIPQTTGKGALRKSSSWLGMMLTTGKGYFSGLVRTCVKRQMVWVRMCEFSQMKTILSSSMMRVKRSRKVSRLNMLRMEQTHSRMKKTFASSQQVIMVIFCWLMSRSSYSLLKLIFLNSRSRQQRSKSSIMRSIWKRLSVCRMVSLMFSSLCLQMASRSILTMLMRFLRISSKKEKKGQQVMMQKTRWVMPISRSLMFSSPSSMDLKDSLLDRAPSQPSLLILDSSWSSRELLECSMLPREMLSLLRLVSSQVQSWMPMQMQKRRWSGLMWLRSSLLLKWSSKEESGHSKLRMKLFRLVQQYDISSIVFSLALLLPYFLIAMPEGNTNFDACISMSFFSFFEYRISPSNSFPILLSSMYSLIVPSFVPNTLKFSIMPTCLRRVGSSCRPDMRLGSRLSRWESNRSTDIFSEKSLNWLMRVESSFSRSLREARLAEQREQQRVLDLPGFAVSFLTLMRSISSNCYSSRLRSLSWQNSSLQLEIDSILLKLRSSSPYILIIPLQPFKPTPPWSCWPVLRLCLQYQDRMGPISPYGPKQFGRLSEQDILREAERFMGEEKILENVAKEEAAYKNIRLLIAKINIYGHRHLLDHIRNTPDSEKKLAFLNQWRELSFENLDLLFQNLIRKKIMRIDDEQVFTKIDVHDKYAITNRELCREVDQRGVALLRDRKVGVIMFVGCSATKGEDDFTKEFLKDKPSDKCLFEIMMERLENIGENHGFPPTYIFYNKNNVANIKEFLEGYKFKNHIQLCEQNNQPILNLNGNLCLKSKDSGEVIQLPNGAGDFYHSTIRNVHILDKLRLDKVQYVCCVDCENILEVVVDTYMLGLLESRREECDLMYKCTYTDNQKDNIFKRVVLQNGVPKVDTIQAMACYTNYNSKYRSANNTAVLSSPVWMNSLIFQLANVNDILKDTKAMSTFPKMVNYKMKQMNYWSPIEAQEHTDEACYVFERELSDLFINSLFRSQAIMVEREEEYFPVIPSESKYNLKLAYEEYKNKAKHFTFPFYERSRELASSDFRMQSMITEERD